MSEKCKMCEKSDAKQLIPPVDPHDDDDVTEVGMSFLVSMF